MSPRVRMKSGSGGKLEQLRRSRGMSRTEMEGGLCGMERKKQKSGAEGDGKGCGSIGAKYALKQTWNLRNLEKR